MDSEFLKLCGFEPEQINKEEPRIERAFGILGIDDSDIERAKAKLIKYFDVELPGMRKVMGLWLKELVDMVLAREEGKKIIYVSYPPIPQMVAALALTSDDVYCASPDIVISNTVNLMFDKIIPVLETAEKTGLSPGIAFCSYLQTRLGSIVKGLVPMPDLLIPSCFLCDLTPATDQLLHELYGIPVAYVDNLIDERGHRWPEDINPRKVEYFSIEMKNCIEKYKQLTGLELPDDEVRKAVGIADSLNYICGQIQELRKTDPLPFSQNDYHLAFSLNCIGRGLKEGPGVLNTLLDDLKKRVAAGQGIVKKGAPRVMLVMIPHDPSLADTIRELGLAACVTAAAAPKDPSQPVYTDLWEDVAASQMRGRGANYSSLAYIIQLKEAVKQSNVDGVIFFRHYSCRQYSIFPLKAKEVIEKEMGIPVLLLDGDYCDFRSYNTQQMSTRLETFAEMIKNDKAARERIG
ncbi:MAG: 2-hydroxyacyl-CoA dehydratase [Dehalococcoidales bacterium]|nr:2-hydroxyacyl-CoA dehydratase [Dehalococcoidales bacterium]